MALSLQLLLLNTVLASSIAYPYSLASNELQEQQTVLAIDSNQRLHFQIFCPIELHANIILQLEEETLGKRIQIVFNTDSEMNTHFSDSQSETQVNACLQGMNHTVHLSFKQLDIYDVHTLRPSDNRCMKTENWPIGILNELLLLTDITAHFCKRHNLNTQNLSLANNGIINIPPNIFQTQIDLINLDLSYNDIAAMDDDLFAGMEKLQVLRLSHNRLSDISR